MSQQLISSCRYIKIQGEIESVMSGLLLRYPHCVARHVTRLVVDYFTYARVWVPRHVAWLVVDYFASRGSSLTTSTMPRVRVPWHIARLVVDYFASRRLVRCASGCLGSSRGSSCRSSSTT
jgi:hypothetical protein